MSKAVTSTFHLHNACTSWELTVEKSGQCLRHDMNPVYVGITLDRNLSYEQPLTKTANILWASSLAACYTVVEYCTLIWFHSAHTNLLTFNWTTACGQYLQLIDLLHFHSFQSRCATLNWRHLDARQSLTNFLLKWLYVDIFHPPHVAEVTKTAVVSYALVNNTHC